MGDEAELDRCGRTGPPPSEPELAPPPNFLKNLLVLLRMLDEKLLRLVSLCAVDGRDEDLAGLPPNGLGFVPAELDGRGGLMELTTGSGRGGVADTTGEFAKPGGTGTWT